MRTFVCILSVLLGFMSISVSQNNPEYYLRRCPYLSPKIEKMIGMSVDDTTFSINLSKITESKSENQITIRTSKISTISINVLKMVNNSDVVAVLFNVEYPTKNSFISFYDKDMHLLPKDRIMEFMNYDTIIDNLSCADNIKVRIKQLISPLHVYFSFDNQKLNAEIMITTTVEDERNDDLMCEINKIRRYTYEWNASKYIIRN